jgi:hypothetical protein
VKVTEIPVEDNAVFKVILQRTGKQGKHDTEDIQHMAANEKKIRKYRAEKRVKPLLKFLGIFSNL